MFRNGLVGGGSPHIPSKCIAICPLSFPQVQYENARLEPVWSQEVVETLDTYSDLYVPMYPSPAKLEKYALE